MKYLTKFSCFALAFGLLISSCGENDSDDPTDENDCGVTCAHTLTSAETAATIPSTANGTYTFTYTEWDSDSPYYADGFIAKFVISNNTMNFHLANHPECITFTKPIATTVAHEIDFIDSCDKNVRYRININNDGTIGDIGVYSLDGSKGYGEFN
ncbi:hypothetical protein ACV07N_11025 [Roseivirga echinicomitans]